MTTLLTSDPVRFVTTVFDPSVEFFQFIFNFKQILAMKKPNRLFEKIELLIKIGIAQSLSENYLFINSVLHERSKNISAVLKELTVYNIIQLTMKNILKNYKLHTQLHTISPTPIIFSIGTLICNCIFYLYMTTLQLVRVINV